ncbi:ABC transporter substrate-binding protein [Gordonia sp. CPCC 205333]|uniref:ABC transporter substrate-binding protein n=1 Tax=Gordonia sp. CPCC 205333 TaxID=3140790 RepID=UPI003AF3D12B
MRGLRKVSVAVSAFALAAMLGGCGGDHTTPQSNPPSSGTPLLPSVERDNAIADQVPAKIRSTGKMTVGINVPYEPNEFVDRTGTLVGFDVDLMNSIGTVLGVVPDFRRSKFAALITDIPKGRYDLAISSITDNSRREKSMDFVTYFNAGVSWASRAGDLVDPSEACGKRVVVKAGTVADRVDVSARSDACKAQGRKEIVVIGVGDQDEVTRTLLSGKADAMAADSPLVAYQVKQSSGQLVLAPGVFLSQPYGIAFEKGSALVEPVRAALQSLMDSGEYQRIARKWGVENGTIPSALINGAYG